jgi:hypothetical protein
VCCTLLWILLCGTRVRIIGLNASWVKDITIVPGTETSQYMPVELIVTMDTPSDTAPVLQYSLPIPAAPTKTRSLAADEIDAQVDK